MTVRTSYLLEQSDSHNTELFAEKFVVISSDDVTVTFAPRYGVVVMQNFSPVILFAARIGGTYDQRVVQIV